MIFRRLTVLLIVIFAFRAGAVGPVEIATVSGQDLHVGQSPALLYDFNVVIMEGGLWNAENTRLQLKNMEEVFNKCGIGIGTVKLYSLPVTEKNLYDGGLNCTRFRTKQEPEYRCKPGPGDEASKRSIQTLAQLTATLPRPTLHLIEKLEPNPGSAMAFHKDQKARKLWTQKKKLKAPVTADEKKHLDFFNNSLGTAFVGHGIDPAIKTIGAANKIDDPELAVRMAHEMTHLLGVDHDPAPEKSFMHEQPGYSQGVNDDLCRQMRASPVLRPSNPAASSPPHSMPQLPPGEAIR